MAQYERNPPLEESQLHPDPLVQFERWLQDATDAGMQEPTAMTLATATPDGRPSARVVLFKGLHDGGLTFYTNYESRKGHELAHNARAALVFWWDRLERQVRVEGAVERVPAPLSDEYFRIRPRLSQLAASASRQSRVAASREALDRRLDEVTRRYQGQDVPRPEYWGGYLLRPQWLEFWQGRGGRLHDRLAYRRDGGAWVVERLEP
ncbi:MAG: pyridoxamine 5'-phosphate oxidase [Gammaproteobacteria bacterium]|nr:pyridoxamine 5'-phosphate oxidase [Gammaproteobacteria bacterium]